MLSQTSRTASGDGDGERDRQGWREKEKRIAAVCVLPCASLSLSLSPPPGSICPRASLFFSCKYRSRPDYHDKWQDFTHPRIISDTRRKEETGEGDSGAASGLERIYRRIVVVLIPSFALVLAFPLSRGAAVPLHGLARVTRYRERYSLPPGQRIWRSVSFRRARRVSSIIALRGCRDIAQWNYARASSVRFARRASAAPRALVLCAISAQLPTRRERAAERERETEDYTLLKIKCSVNNNGERYVYYLQERRKFPSRPHPLPRLRTNRPRDYVTTDDAAPAKIVVSLA